MVGSSSVLSCSPKAWSSPAVLPRKLHEPGPQAFHSRERSLRKWTRCKMATNGPTRLCGAGKLYPWELRRAGCGNGSAVVWEPRSSMTLKCLK